MLVMFNMFSQDDNTEFKPLQLFVEWYVLSITEVFPVRLIIDYYELSLKNTEDKGDCKSDLCYGQ